MNKAVVRKLRCAVYTRKSSEEGLEQEFNSLDAQHEACEAYIASQGPRAGCLFPTAMMTAASPARPWSVQGSSACSPTSRRIASTWWSSTRSTIRLRTEGLASLAADLQQKAAA